MFFLNNINIQHQRFICHFIQLLHFLIVGINVFIQLMGISFQFLCILKSNITQSKILFYASDYIILYQVFQRKKVIF